MKNAHTRQIIATVGKEESKYCRWLRKFAVIFYEDSDYTEDGLHKAASLNGTYTYNFIIDMILDEVQTLK